MTPKQKRSLVMASIIGTLFGCYDDDERTRLHDELHSRIGKGIRKQVKLFGKECIVKVSHDEGNAIWKDSVDHFADKQITIEHLLVSCRCGRWTKRTYLSTTD
jgi:hypothetical protein